MTEAGATLLQPEPGIYHGIPFNVYASWDAWNPSTIKVMLSDSAMAMRHTMQHGRPSSESMDLGRAEHCCVLEPLRVAECYAIMPAYERDEANVTEKGTRSTSKATLYYKGKVAEFEAANVGREIIEADDYARCVRMRDAIYAHQSAPALLREPGHTEVSIVWRDKQTGLLCKGRIDWWVPAQHRLVDLKTAADPRPFAFLSQVARLHYHVSLGAYVAGLEAHGHETEYTHFITVGNKPWHDVIRYDNEPSMIRHGRTLWHTSLQRVAWCIKNDQWPGYCAEPYPGELPAWAIPDDEAEAVSDRGQAA